MNNSNNALRALFLLFFGLVTQSACALSYQEQLERCQKVQVDGNEEPDSRLALLGALTLARTTIFKELQTPHDDEQRLDDGFYQTIDDDGTEIALKDDELQEQLTLLDEWITDLAEEWSLANPLIHIASGVPGGLVAIATPTN